MTKVLYAFLSFSLFLTSCANSYDIQGTSNVSGLDGRKLYLKVNSADTLKTIDSCDVVHGRFIFQGNIDSVRVAQIFMDDVNLQFPIVLEQGNIQLRLDNTQQQVSGTPLNDKINDFWIKFTQIRNQYIELDHEESAAIMNGQDENEVNSRLLKQALQVYASGDKLFTKFVTDNFENILGPWGFFTRITYDTTPDAYPSWMNDYLYLNAVNQLSSWIDFIMMKAPDSFKNDPQVKDFYTNFQQTQNEMNGTAETTSTSPTDNQSVTPPTPAERAGDSIQTE